MSIAMNLSNLVTRITALRNAANAFSKEALSATDDESTIVANLAAQEAFSASQEAHDFLSETLIVSADLIGELRDSFVHIDQQAGQQMRSS